jgi:tetratricopeptide (TPR) repeat protein
MRISWLSATQLAIVRRHLVGVDVVLNESSQHDWERHFAPSFVAPDAPANVELAQWPHMAEHVARAERITAMLQQHGLAATHARFGDSAVAIEAATLAAAAHFADELVLADVQRVIRCDIDPYLFYAHLLELLVNLTVSLPGGKLGVIHEYQDFVDRYERALQRQQMGSIGVERIGAALDGLADLYVSRAMYDSAQALYERRHREDSADVAVALSASRAFLAAGVLGHAVQWLELAAVRARHLGRQEMADKLERKRDIIHGRMS